MQPDAPPTLPVLELPSELLAHILCFLPLEDLISASQSFHLFRSVCSSSTLNPWTLPIASALSDADADDARSAIAPWARYSRALEKLACFSIVPRKNWVDILVQGHPAWVTQSLELPAGLEQSIWEEATRRRFLPSWIETWRRREMNWRTLFLRIASRTSHRIATTCTAEESYTRWITLDRRGSATLNRVRAAGFDPLAIFHEIKFQANLHALPTTVRLVVRLADVNILALGVLFNPTSLFVNPNAFSLLHPPALYPDLALGQRELTSWEKRRDRSLSVGGGELDEGEPGSRSRKGGRLGLSAFGRTLSGPGASSPTSPPSAGLGTSIATFLKPRPHPNSSVFSIGSSSSKARPLISSASTLSPAPSSSLPIQPPLPSSASSPTLRYKRPDVARPRLPTSPQLLPYTLMRHPTPRSSHALYPNATPSGFDTRRRPSGAPDPVWSTYIDDEDEDEAEWPEVDGSLKWVGPMMLIAAFPPDSSLHSDLAQVPNQNAPGHQLLPRDGSYASFEWEDLWAVAPWLKESLEGRCGGGVGFLREGL